ncbi:MAG: UDP-N-acetylmuramoyl-tripeptide--D-alanyl-D-alanine ligase [Clostridia bacterium]|nr:UDP-N-acetylmuramoyl-tripeptide--D-alanyl-D-alanine ligase [Clostridia bacterium]
MWLNISLLLFYIYFYKKIRHGLHILQLENYYNDRYITWVKKNIKTLIDIKTICFMIVPILFFIIEKNNLAYLVEIILFIYLILNSKRKKEKKPFVNTSRIKRMFFTYLILAVLIAYVVNNVNTVLAILIINFISIIAYIFVYIVNLINSPVENGIRKKFCKLAMDKLKDLKTLEVVGITGSYGKTSTKYIVNTILSQKFNTLMTPESYNTTMGVVRTINENLSPVNNLFVCEMGAKYPGDIKEICDIVNPKYAIITAIGPQHLDTFKTLENVRNTKLELVDSLPEDGIAFVNWEDENIRNSIFKRNIVKYGLNSDADYYAKNIEINEHGSEFDVVIPGKGNIHIKTKLLGSLNVLNIVCAVAVSDKLGLTEEEIKLGAKYIKQINHRLEIKQNSNGSIIIDDAYNSNNKGAKMALEVLKNFKDRQRILITPGIVELGDRAEEINKEFGKNAAESSDYIILVGEKQADYIYKGIKEKGYSDEKVFIAKNLEEALVKMNQIITPNSVVLLENDLPDNYL